ncbi:hypothetical protein [Allobaculum sp. Allo2]|uniref:hypothetical protein n=1 Tax=Allobaculum sp. Allo2 TaxID=2853432 RepID=UPI001F6081D7|nr:hypothetical protein [Allobaculum sp. Allo2]UNT93822.1 hypothetical protein KWG61_03620 [Allobaculum sp. Allo2]
MKKVPRELTDLACGWKYQILELEVRLAQEQQDFRKESELCKQMEKLADKSGFLSQTQARSIENQRLLNQADQEYAAGQYRLCIETYSRFLEADAVTLEQDILQAAVRRTMAEAYRKLNRTDEAIKCVDAAMHSLLVRLKESQEARKEMIACLFCRAEISEQNNDWLSADHCYQRALNHLQKLTGPKYSVKTDRSKKRGSRFESRKMRWICTMPLSFMKSGESCTPRSPGSIWLWIILAPVERSLFLLRFWKAVFQFNLRKCCGMPPDGFLKARRLRRRLPKSGNRGQSDPHSF